MGKPSDSTPNFDFLFQSEKTPQESLSMPSESSEKITPEETELTKTTDQSTPESAQTAPVPETTEIKPSQSERTDQSEEPIDETKSATSEGSVLDEDENDEILAEDSVFSDFEDIPEPDENNSDGSTLVMQKSQGFEHFTPEEETFEEEEPTQRIESSPSPEGLSTTNAPDREQESTTQQDLPPDTKTQIPTQIAQSESAPNFSFLDSAPKLPVEKPISPVEATNAESSDITHDIRPAMKSPEEIESDTVAESIPEAPTSASDEVDSLDDDSFDVVKTTQEVLSTSDPVAPSINASPTDTGNKDTKLDKSESKDPDTKPTEPAGTTNLPPAEAQSTPAAAEAKPVAKPEIRKAAPPQEAKIMGLDQRLVLILLASYASAITLILIMMLMNDNKSHQLESLPDVVPEAESNLSYIRPDAQLPEGHTLQVGDSERYGNLKVEVLKITREPITFVHYNGDTKRSKEPTAPVWKLWLRFTNVSEDQTFAPLDRDLTLRWITKEVEMREYSNYYIFAVNNPDPTVQSIQMYRLPKSSDWDMQFQNLGKELKPGESTEAFIATSDEQPIDLNGKLLWRFQFRKGISPSGNGVTTMVEVAFKPEDVISPS